MTYPADFFYIRASQQDEIAETTRIISIETHRNRSGLTQIISFCVFLCFSSMSICGSLWVVFYVYLNYHLCVHLWKFSHGQNACRTSLTHNIPLPPPQSPPQKTVQFSRIAKIVLFACICKLAMQLFISS